MVSFSLSSTPPEDELKIIRTSDQIQFVRPPDPDAPRDEAWDLNTPRDDVCVSGIVEVNLRERRRVKCLVVRFVTWAKLYYPSRSIRRLSNISDRCANR